MLNFGGRAVWGLDVGESALKAVKMAKTGAGLAVQDFQVIPYRSIEGAGASKREDLVFQALMQFFTPLDRQGVRFIASIPSQNVFSRFIGLPPVDRRRVPEIVRYEARQQIPFDLSEVIWDYQLVRPDFMPGEEIEIGLFAVKREVINAFLVQFVMAQDWLEGVQIAPLALYNFLRADQQLERPTVVIDIGAQSTDLLIVEGAKFWLRNLPIAGNSFNALLEKKFSLSPEDAEKLKRGLGQHKHRRQVFEVLRPVLKDLVAEVQRSIGYYKSLAREVKFDQVLLMGEGHRLYGLHRFLSDQLQYRVRPLGEFKALQLQVPAERQEEFQAHLPGLAVAVGLGVQGLNEGDVTVDLLREDFTVRRELKRKRVPAAVVAALLWAAVLLLFVGQRLAVARVANLRFEGPRVVDEDGRPVRQFIEEEQIDAVIARADALTREYQEAQREVKTAVLDQFRPLGRARDFWAQAVAGLLDAIPSDPPIFIDKIELRGAAVGAGRPGMDDPYDDYEAERRPGMRERTPAAATGHAFTFHASMDQRHREDMLIRHFPRQLEAATIYPERVKLFSRVTVGEPRFQTTQAPGTGMGTFDEDYEMMDEPGSPRPRERRERAETVTELVVEVVAVLRSREEIAAEVDRIRHEAALKHEQQPPGGVQGTALRADAQQ